MVCAGIVMADGAALIRPTSGAVFRLDIRQALPRFRRVDKVRHPPLGPVLRLSARKVG